MLTSPVRSISDFSSAAGDVRLQITKARAGNDQSFSEAERESLRTIDRLVTLGNRYAEPPGGNLDVTGSTPEQIDLAVKLKDLVPGELEAVKLGGDLSIPLWASQAAAILRKFVRGSRWGGLSEEEREFVQVELEPFLKSLQAEAPEEPQE